MEVPIMSEVFSRGEKPEFLFWVGCAGAFDERYKLVTRAFATILNHLSVSYAVLGTEETCNGDPARRAGNELLFQMQAFKVIEILQQYEVKKILTICPHCYNIFKNEYPDLGGKYEVIHHTQFLAEMIKSGKLALNKSTFMDKMITFHDPCYLGRANGVYADPRKVISSLAYRTKEMKRNKSFAFCCGAGGAQMFKEAEQGDKEVYMERTEELLETGASIVATACPFCMTMLTDGLKYKNKQEDVKNYDIAELVTMALGI
jgi:heterodisulfide reductase subunit D